MTPMRERNTGSATNADIGVRQMGQMANEHNKKTQRTFFQTSPKIVREIVR